MNPQLPQKILTLPAAILAAEFFAQDNCDRGGNWQTKEGYILGVNRFSDWVKDRIEELMESLRSSGVSSEHRDAQLEAASEIVTKKPNTVKGKNMKFYEAMMMFQDGHKVRPVKWEDKNYYISFAHFNMATCFSAFHNCHEEWEILEERAEKKDLQELTTQLLKLLKEMQGL